MGAKRTILLAGAVVLTAGGFFFWDQSGPATFRKWEVRPAPDYPSERQVWGSIPKGRDFAVELAPPTVARSAAAREDDAESVRQLAESDPPAAATWASRLSEGPARVDAIKVVAIAWANRDLPGAVEWARQLPNES